MFIVRKGNFKNFSRREAGKVNLTQMSQSLKENTKNPGQSENQAIICGGILFVL